MNFQNFDDIYGMSFDGVTVEGSNGPGEAKGILKLSGLIETFVIGGQELWLDDVCASGYGLP